jgi:hypothetical protein
MKVIYFYEDAYGIGGTEDMTRELAATRFDGHLPDSLLAPPQWRARRPTYPPVIEPRDDEPVFPKDSKDGFQTTNADYYLRTWGVDTLIAVGFALGSCLFHTCMGARHRNYRVIVLRDCTDPPGHGEFADTRDATNPEGGWMRFAFLRQIETNVGYTSTSGEVLRALQAGHTAPCQWPSRSPRWWPTKVPTWVAHEALVERRPPFWRASACGSSRPR